MEFECILKTLKNIYIIIRDKEDIFVFPQILSCRFQKRHNKCTIF